MTMKFWRSGSTVALGALLLAAVGCSMETTSEEQEAEIGRATEAICDTSYYAPICLSQCQGSCTDGSAIASCMSVCMGGYCAPQFQAPASCNDQSWRPELAVTGPIPGCT